MLSSKMQSKFALFLLLLKLTATSPLGCTVTEPSTSSITREGGRGEREGAPGRGERGEREGGVREERRESERKVGRSERKSPRERRESGGSKREGGRWRWCVNILGHTLHRQTQDHISYTALVTILILSLTTFKGAAD